MCGEMKILRAIGCEVESDGLEGEGEEEEE